MELGTGVGRKGVELGTNHTGGEMSDIKMWGSVVLVGVEVGKLDGPQKRISAAVVRFPFYDPAKKRPRS